MKNIVNIVNFVRAVEPREGRNIDLEKPIIEQTRIMRELGLRGTFLLQYDALISPNFRNLLADYTDICEIGLWFEIVQPLVEDIGEEWHGRYPWDWYNDVGFLIGYEPEVRIRLIDKAMNKFKELYGYYPKSVGSWHIDSVSMRHLAEKYNIDACCICRDQVGTDGYTMQGGYYNQAYYPSINNMFCPAKTLENQINMPVFRMLGSDPVYNYDSHIITYGLERNTATLEAGQLGRNPAWCDWFFKEIFNGNGLSFGYTQAGQENSFGWKVMGPGIEYQFPKIAELQKDSKVEVMTLGESGRYYKERFKTTPASAIATNDAWLHPNMRSIWYCSKHYRTNIFVDNDGVAKIRDIYVFDEQYPEHYLTKRCDTHACEFRNLPVMDGCVYSNVKEGIVAGVYLTKNGEVIKWDSVKYDEPQENTSTVVLSLGSEFAKFTMTEQKIAIETNIDGFALSPKYDKQRVLGTEDFADQYANHNNGKTNISFVTKAEIIDNRIDFTFDGFDYSVTAEKGEIKDDFSVTPQNDEIVLKF